MKPLTKILLLVALTALPLFAMTASTQGAKRMEVAIQNEGVFLYNNYYNQDTAYRQLRELGATHLRMNLFWFQAVVPSQQRLTSTPADVQYDFSLWDAAVAKARSYGIKVQFALTGDPPVFACGSRRGNWTSATASSRTARCTRTSSARRSPTSGAA